MKHEAFNQLYVSATVLFFMIMYIWAFATNKHLDIDTILQFAVPTLTFLANLITRSINIKNGAHHATQEGEIPEGHS